MKAKLVFLACVCAVSCMLLFACSSEKESEEVKVVTVETASDDSKETESSDSEGSSEPQSVEQDVSESDATTGVDTTVSDLRPGAFFPGINEPFYGIWIGAFSVPDNATNFMIEAQNKGIPAFELISSEWSNLNPNTYHVVCAWAFRNEADAQASLSYVQGMGYPDAYVKYTGEHY